MILELQRILDETDVPLSVRFQAQMGWKQYFVRSLAGEGAGAWSSAIILALLDLSVTFDIIDHGILLGQLQKLGMGGTVLVHLLPLGLIPITVDREGEIQPSVPYLWGTGSVFSPLFLKHLHEAAGSSITIG